MARSLSILLALSLSFNIFYCCYDAQAQALIDTGPINTDIFLSWLVDTSTPADIYNMPMFDSFLGTQTNATITGSLTFGWPQANYSVDHDTFPQPGPIATENVDINIYTSNYLQGSSDYQNSFVGEAIFCSASPKCPPFSIPNAAGSASLGPLNRTGTSIPTFQDTQPQTTTIKVDLSSNFQGQGSFTPSGQGEYTITGSVDTDVKYIPLTASKYVAEAINNSSGVNALDTGYKSLMFITSLRNLDPGTSSTNLQLRDAQYALYGYNAGAMLRNAINASDSLGAFSALLAQGNASGQGFGGPIALTIYNNLKVAAQAGCDECAAIVNGLGNPNLPGTAPGGVIPNTLGFSYGYAFPNDISGLPAAVNSNSFSVPLGNGPIQPNMSIHFSDDGSSLDLFDLLAQGGVSIFFDPQSSEDYAFSVVGAGISEFELPSIDGSQLIDIATLIVDGKSVQIAGGVWIDLEALFGGDPSTIVIADLQGSLMPNDPIFGFRFDQTANISVTELGFTPGAVPEPATWSMIIAGFGLLLVARRKRATWVAIRRVA